MKLRSKIILYFVLPIFLLNLVCSVYNLGNSLVRIRKMSEENFCMETALIAAELSRQNTQGVAIASTAAIAASDIGLGDRPQDVAYIKNLLARFPDYVGASMGYEPNLDGRDALALKALNNIKEGKNPSDGGAFDSYDFSQNKTSVDINTWIEKSMGGRFLVYWGKKGNQWLLEPLVDMETSMYYAGLKKMVESGGKDGYIITEPYVYKDGGLMIEYSAPIMVDGKFGGQVALDRSLGYLHEKLLSLKTYADSEFFLVSKSDRVIVSTLDQAVSTMDISDLYQDDKGNFETDFLKLKNGQLVRDNAVASNIDFSKYSSRYRDILRMELGDETLSSDKMRIFKDGKDGSRFCVAHSAVYPSGWTLVQIVPESKIYAPIIDAIINEAVSQAVFFFAMLFIAVLLRKFTKSIEYATSAAEKVAQGDLRGNLDGYKAGRDEVGRLMQSLTKMTVNLRSLINRVKLSSVQLTSSASGMESASADCEGRVHSFGASTAQIAAAIREITATSAELYRTLSQLAKVASSSSDTADSGRKQLSNMEKTMNLLSSNTQTVARGLSLISQKADNIGSVITTISKVADETNLLSLNAAIEAEKAGSYGVGFAVVAKEIGRLADQTAMATDDIEVLVKDMQSAVKAGVLEMNKFSDEVRHGVAEVGRIILGMDSIITQMQEIAPQLEKITEGMQSQNLGANQISQAITNLNDSARQTGELLGEFASARKQLHDAIMNMREEISKFKLGN